MAMQAAATVTSLAHARAAERSGRRGVYTLEGLYEICAFLQAEIRASKRHYNALALAAGCCVKTVSNIANGETKNPSTRTLCGLMRALHFHIEAVED